MTPKKSVYIIGAGPAGLTAAKKLTLHNQFKVSVLEKRNKVGGISRTESYKGYYFDIGGHRFFTKNKAINTLWRETLGEDLLTVRRISSIYYRQKYFHYPLRFWSTLLNLGPYASFLISASYLKAIFFPLLPEKTFEQWTINRFGKRLYRMFFKEYTEKVWGIPCSKIQADWAAQRIQGLSLSVAVLNAIFGSSRSKSLIEEFHYPKFGPGMMWNAFQKNVETQGGNVELNSEVISLKHSQGIIQAITYQKDGKKFEEPVDQVISSTPINLLINLLNPPPPKNVLKAAKKLSYRAFIIVILIIDKKDLFPDQWLYIHSPDVSVGRIQNFKNWSQAMVPENNTTSLGMEYFCSENEAIWQLSDEKLTGIASREIEALGVTTEKHVVDSYVVRQPKAYPVYDEGFKKHVAVIKDYLESYTNLQTIGRAGMHRYNNMDHSMMTGTLAAENIVGARNDIWQVNDEKNYLEKIQNNHRTNLRLPSFINRYKKTLASTIGIVFGVYYFFIF